MLRNIQKMILKLETFTFKAKIYNNIIEHYPQLTVEYIFRNSRFTEELNEISITKLKLGIALKLLNPWKGISHGSVRVFQSTVISSLCEGKKGPAWGLFGNTFNAMEKKRKLLKMRALLPKETTNTDKTQYIWQLWKNALHLKFLRLNFQTILLSRRSQFPPLSKIGIKVSIYNSSNSRRRSGNVRLHFKCKGN